MMRAAWLLITLYACGCSQVFADKHDYRAYRAVRLAEHDLQRLHGMRAYLAELPRGQWAAEFRQTLAAREQGIFDAPGPRAQALTTYLALYPEGHYARQAGAWLRARQTALTLRAAEQRRRATASKAQRTQAEADDTREADRLIGAWFGHLLELDDLPQPLQALPERHPAFAAAMAEGDPAVCDEALCEKRLVRPFHVPVVGGTRLEREWVLTVRLVLKGPQLVEVALGLPGAGLCRWYEFAERAPCSAANPEDRALALARAERALRAWAEVRDPFAQGPPRWRIEPAPAGEDDQLDLIRIRPQAP